MQRISLIVNCSQKCSWSGAILLAKQHPCKAAIKFYFRAWSFHMSPGCSPFICCHDESRLCE